jgi:hypothetical protein
VDKLLHDLRYANPSYVGQSRLLCAKSEPVSAFQLKLHRFSIPSRRGVQMCLRSRFIAAVLVMLIGYATAQSLATQSDEPLLQLLVNLETRSWEAWKARDGQYFAGFLSDDHVEVGRGGLTGKAQVVAFVSSPGCVIDSYSVGKFRLTRISDDSALLDYQAEQDTKCFGHPVPTPAWSVPCLCAATENG